MSIDRLASTASFATSNSPTFTGTVTMSGATVIGAGMDLITPTSVAGTGVTLSGGAVSFTTATAVSVNGCFSATYNNYFCTYNMTSSTNNNLYARLRVSGTDSAASTYNLTCSGWTFSTGAAANIDYGSATTVWVLVSQATGIYTGGNISLFSPFSALPTQMVGEASRSELTARASGAFTASTSFDGFTIYPTAGTITGSLRVYGLRNS